MATLKVNVWVKNYGRLNAGLFIDDVLPAEEVQGLLKTGHAYDETDPDVSLLLNTGADTVPDTGTDTVPDTGTDTVPDAGSGGDNGKINIKKKTRA